MHKYTLCCRFQDKLLLSEAGCSKAVLTYCAVALCRPQFHSSDAQHDAFRQGSVRNARDCKLRKHVPYQVLWSPLPPVSAPLTRRCMNKRYRRFLSPISNRGCCTHTWQLHTWHLSTCPQLVHGLAPYHVRKVPKRSFRMLITHGTQYCVKSIDLSSGPWVVPAVQDALPV